MTWCNDLKITYINKCDTRRTFPQNSYIWGQREVGKEKIIEILKAFEVLDKYDILKVEEITVN